MNITKALERWLAYSYQKIWDNGKIAKRPVWLIWIIPILLCALAMWFKLSVLGSGSPPFLLFFVVVTLTASYGGIRGAFIGTVVTTVFALLLHFFWMKGEELIRVFSFLQILLYFCQCIFLTALLHRFHRNEQRCAIQYNEALKAKQEIQEREKLHEDFVHMATHELKAPVTVLKAYLQLAEMKIKMPDTPPAEPIGKALPQFMELVSKMNFQLDRLVSLINDLLESTRIKAGALNCQMEPFNIVSCLHDCVEGFKAAEPEAFIDCSLPSGRVIVNGDESRIEQVILNLLSNAVKYSPVKPIVHVSCEQIDGRVYIRIKDQGIGIPNDMKKSVFTRFVRVKSPEMSKFPGLGLGLYICAEIINVHDGEIDVESILGKGSTFWFALPVHNL
jgi:signal transduction histidine kinase